MLWFWKAQSKSGCSWLNFVSDCPVLLSVQRKAIFCSPPLGTTPTCLPGLRPGLGCFDYWGIFHAKSIPGGSQISTYGSVTLLCQEYSLLLTNFGFFQRFAGRLAGGQDAGAGRQVGLAWR